MLQLTCLVLGDAFRWLVIGSLLPDPPALSLFSFCNRRLSVVCFVVVADFFLRGLVLQGAVVICDFCLRLVVMNASSQ